jgi:hypothetical protein
LVHRRDIVKLQQLHEGIGADAKELALDLFGFVPVAGDIVDGIRGLKAAQEGKYLDAAFLLISIIPEIGDAAGKGTKWVYKLLRRGVSPKTARTIIRAIAKVRPLVKQAWKVVLKTAGKTKKWEPYIRDMASALDNAMQEWDKITQQIQQQHGGQQQAQPA